jgi:uncharacterized damage-inducible protein DinB
MKPRRIFAHWKGVRNDLLATIDKFGQDELVHVPFEGSWPVGSIMLHIADAEDGWFRYVVTQELDEWPDQYVLENYPKVADIKMVLTEVHAATEAYLETLVEADLEREIEAPWGGVFRLEWIIWHVLEHEIHHRGELSFILGTLGREGLDV